MMRRFRTAPPRRMNAPARKASAPITPNFCSTRSPPRERPTATAAPMTARPPAATPRDSIRPGMWTGVLACRIRPRIESGYRPRRFMGSGLLAFFGLLKVVDEDAVADAGGIFGFGHLKGHEPAVITHDRVGGLVTRVVAEKGESLLVTAAVHAQFPEVDEAGALPVLPVT